MKKDFKPFVVTFDDGTTLAIGRKTMAKAIDMMAWLCANQPDVTRDDGSFFRVSKTLRGNFAIDSFDSMKRFEERYVQRRAIAYVAQFLKDFETYLDRQCGIVRYDGVRDAKKAKRAHRESLYENR